MSPENDHGSSEHPHVIEFTVDDEPVKTSERELTPVEIMTLANVNPTTHYLVQVEGRHQTSYQDQPNTKIKVHEHAVFVTVSTGPTPVS